MCVSVKQKLSVPLINREIREFGEFRTQRLVLEAWDKLERGELA